MKKIIQIQGDVESLIALTEDGKIYVRRYKHTTDGPNPDSHTVNIYEWIELKDEMQKRL